MTSFNNVMALLLVASLAACGREPAAPHEPFPGDAQVVLDAATTGGQRVVVKTGVTLTGGAALSALSGTLRYDPARLRYLGQPLSGQTLVVVNSVESGRLKLMAYNPAGMEATPVELDFEALGPDWLHGLEFQFSLGATSDGRWYRTASPPATIGPLATPPSDVAPRPLDAADWAAQLRWGHEPARHSPSRTPGQGTVY